MASEVQYYYSDNDYCLFSLTQTANNDILVVPLHMPMRTWTFHVTRPTSGNFTTQFGGAFDLTTAWPNNGTVTGTGVTFASGFLADRPWPMVWIRSTDVGSTTLTITVLGVR